VSGLTNGSFNIPLTGAAATNGSYQVRLSAVDNLGRPAANSVTIVPSSAAASMAWASYYPFTSGAQDANNLYNGTLRNGASITNDPIRGNVLSLRTAASQYVSFPTGVGSAQTFSGWVYWNAGSSWQRVFDFGQNNNDFFFLTTSDASNRLQCAITPNLSVYNQVLESPSPMPINQWTHLAVTMDGRQGILYVNGNAVAVNNSVNLLPSDIGASNCNFGKSQFAADPYFNGRLSDVRLNSTALSAAQLIGPFPIITQPTNGTLFAGGQALNYAGVATDFWGVPLGAAAFTWWGELHTNGLISAAFGPIAGATGGSYLVPTNATMDLDAFYRIYVTVTDTNGNQQMVSQDVQALTSQLAFATVPPGLQLELDGQPFLSPTSMVAVAGMARLVAAPTPQAQAGSNYQFVVWSDGGPASHNILVPLTNDTFTASYLQPEIGFGFAGGALQLAWPGWASAMNLYATPSLAPPVNWSLVTNIPVTSGDVLTLSLPATNGTSFYRLQLP
jgi:hypothetical protein